MHLFSASRNFSHENHNLHSFPLFHKLNPTTPWKWNRWVEFGIWIRGWRKRSIISPRTDFITSNLLTFYQDEDLTFWLIYSYLFLRPVHSPVQPNQLYLSLPEQSWLCWTGPLQLSTTSLTHFFIYLLDFLLSFDDLSKFSFLLKECNAMHWLVCNGIFQQLHPANHPSTRIDMHTLVTKDTMRTWHEFISC